MIYINDFPNYWDLFSILFADDTTGSFSAPTTLELECVINNELSKAKKWFLLNELHLNQLKTRIIHFNTPINQKPKITINNEPIMEVFSTNEDSSERSFKFLGFEIDEKLDFKSHIAKVPKKLVSANFALKSLKNTLPLNQKIQIYNSTFKCYIEYGLPIWGQNASFLSKIISLQERAIFHINGSRAKLHSEPLFKKYNILKIQDIKYLQELNIAHSIIHDYAPTLVKESIPRNINHPLYNFRRPPSDLQINGENKGSVCKFCIPKSWNTLPVQEKLVEKFHLLKQQKRKSIIDAYDNSPICNNPVCIICK